MFMNFLILAHDHHDHVHNAAGAVSLETWMWALASVSILSLIALAGVFLLSLQKTTFDKMVSYLVALAAGAMLGNAAFHLLPETFEEASSPTTAGMLLLVGFVGCYVLEKMLNLHCNRVASHVDCSLKPLKHVHGAPPIKHHHFGGHGHAHRAEYIHPTGWMSLVSHSIHNFGDGVLIAVAFMNSIPLGIACTIAIVLHELPMEFGEFGVLLNAGFKRMQAVWVNMVSGVVALMGTVLTLWLGSSVDGLTGILTPIGAGTVVYIAACGLIPQLQKETCPRKSRIQFAIMIAGLLAMYAVSFME